MKIKSYKPIAYIFVFLLSIGMLFTNATAQTIIMPTNGDTTVFVNSTSSYTILDPGGYNNYPNGTSVITIKSSDGRPFSLLGSYNIGNSHLLTIFQGESTAYPIEDFYSGNGSVKIYCYSGAVTLKLFSTPSGRQSGFEFTLCFPQIYNVYAENTNSTYTNLYWTGSSRAFIAYYQSKDPNRATTVTQLQTSNNYYLPTISSGTEYSYHILPTYGYWGNSYHINDTSNYCISPPHKFRTPKVQDCNSCDHYRECIDFTDFNSTQVICFKGNNDIPDSGECVVDNGPESSISRHTVHNNPNALDPNTNNMLLQVPPGESQSVRLGGWGNEQGHENHPDGESILYEIHVDTNDYDLMMLRYAVVFQQPSGRGRQIPRFSIRLFDQNCVPIEPLCYCRDIIYEDNVEGWNSYTGASNPYKWRDWKSMAIDLSEWHGKTVYLQLSTRDGILNGQAYAYFTLHCGRRQIDHLQQCADNVTNTFFAPEGFNYRWYNVDEPDSTLSTTRSLQVSDSGLYHCIVSPTDCNDPNCGYTINALASPRYPHAAFEVLSTASHCSFYVRFINRSYISGSANDTVPLWTREDCETAFWDFGNGQTSTDYNAEATYTAPGRYVITLIVSIAGGNCTDTISDTLDLQWAHATPYIEGETTLCPGHNYLNLVLHNATSYEWTYVYDNITYPHNDTILELEDISTSSIFTCHATDSNDCIYDYSIPITVRPPINQHVYQTLCEEALPYHFRDTIFNEGTTSGNYTFHRQSVHGCDSNVTLHLTINACNIIIHHYDTVCANELPYIWNTLTFDSAGIQDIRIPIGNGADSIFKHHLYVHPKFDTTLYATICQGETYAFHNHSLTTTGIYTDTLRTIHQCDSIVSLNLTVNPTNDTSFYDTTCSNIPYLFANQPLSSAGVYNHTFSNRYHCDSLVTLNLAIKPITQSSITETIIQNDLPHTFNGVTFSNSITDSVITISNHFGCDSNIHYTLNVLWNSSTTADSTICANMLPLSWNGKTFTQAGTKTATLTAHDNTDSTVVMHLYVNPTYNRNVYRTICDDTNYTFHSNTLASAGNYTDTLLSRHQCDSIVTLHLTVNPTNNITIFDTTCNNIPYLFANQSLDLAGEYTHTFSNCYQCDSLVTLNLTVNNVTQSIINHTVFENDLPHHFNGATFYNEVTDTVITISNNNGCDSNIHFTLTVNWNSSSTVDSTVCDNQLPVTWNGLTFTEASIANITLTSSTNADSIVTMRLHVNPTFNQNYYDTICENDTYSFADSTYYSYGIYTHHLTSIKGCDSTVTLHLTVNAITYSFEHDTIVENDLPYTFNGTTFNDSTENSIVTILNRNGCDSIITYSLTVYRNVTASTDSTICDDMLPLTWNGKTFTNAGTQTALLTAHTGADSLLTMTLHVNPTYNLHFYDTICSNQSITFDDSTYTTAGTYIYPMQSINSCDSTETLHLTVFGTSVAYIHDTIVENRLPYIFNGITFNNDISDTLIVITNNIGCDSSMHYWLFIHRNVTATADSTICDDMLPLTWNGVTFSEAGTQSVLLTAHTGADSLLTMTLHVNPTYDIHYFDTICSNQSITFNDSTYNLTGTYVHTMMSINSCDSVETLHLTVFSTSSDTISQAIVENSLPYSFNGATFYDDVSDTTIVITNVIGCDSSILFSLYIHRNVTTSADSSVCQNYFPFEWNGVQFDSTDTQSALLIAHTGADSLLTMNVTMLFNSYGSWTDTIVEAQLPFDFNGVVISTELFPDTSSYSPDSSIFYPRLSHIDTSALIANIAGCDSLIDYTIYVKWNVHSEQDSTICSELIPFVWNGIVFDSSDLDTAFASGIDIITKNDTLNAASGADSVIFMHLHLFRSYVINFNDTVCEAAYIVWYNDTISVTGIYSQPFTTSQGCDSIEYLHFANYPNYDLTYYDTICDYSGVMRMGVEYIGVSHMNTIYGCDSNEVYHLWGLPVSYSNVDTIISDHQLPFSYYDYTFADTADVQMQLTLVNQYGCDSIVNFTLTVMPTVRISLDSTICESQLPLMWDSTLFVRDSIQFSALNSQLTTLIDTFHTIYGADSIVTRNLHVNPTYQLNYIDTTCNGAPYSFGDSLFTVGGTYTLQYTTVDGCDSIEILQLQVNAMSYATQHDTIVQNQLPYTFGGVTFTELADITDSIITILNTVACDSVITYSLTILPNIYVQKDTTLCDNMFPLQWDGLTFTLISNVNLYYDSIVNIMSDGTDSITRYLVTVYPTFNQTDSVDICDNMLPYDWQGTIIDSNAIHGHTSSFSTQLLTQNGCDSLLNLILTVHPTLTSSDSIVSCEPIEWIDGNSYSTSTSGITHTLQTIHGCDSIVILEFTRVNHIESTLFDTICQGVGYPFGGVEYTVSGIYHDSLLTTFGCDSIIILNLEVLTPPDIEFICDYDCDARTYTINVTTDAPYISWSATHNDDALETQRHNRTITVRPQTHETYILYADYKDVPTCPLTKDTNLSPLLRPHADMDYSPEFLTFEQNRLDIISRCTNEENRKWFINDVEYDGDYRISYLANPENEDSVSITLIAIKGLCSDTAYASVPFRKATFWVPNTFTPGENSNNRFFVRYLGITDYSIDLYTRGGVLVWHSENMDDSWDGTFKGKPCPQETYVWIIYYRDVTAPDNLLSKKGTVTLLR